MKLMTVLLFMFSMLVTGASAFAVDNYIDAKGVVKTRVAEYVTVVNSAAAPLTKGMAVCYDLAEDNGIAVDYCYAEGAKPAGVVVNTSCAVGARCKLQTKGFIDFGRFDYLATPTVAGGLVYAGNDGDIVVPATATVAMFPLGSAFDAVSADVTTLKVFIDL